MKKVLGFLGAMLMGAFLTLSVQAAMAHPEMHKAKEQLVGAKHSLEHATHDYEGHRAKAMEHIDMAIGEIDRGLEHAR
jgi:hypothetical protein